MSRTVNLYKGTDMAIETTYTQARANLKALLDEVAENREQVIIHRRGGDDVAMIAADELRGLLETAHLLRSPRNAERLLSALRRAQARKGRRETTELFRRQLGLERDE
jgi:antitoxin YefM